MTEHAYGLSSATRAHLERLIKSSGLPETEESLDEIARVWLEKKDMFEGQVRALDMREREWFAADDPRGALLLTWSWERRRRPEDRVREYRALHRCPVP